MLEDVNLKSKVSKAHFKEAKELFEQRLPKLQRDVRAAGIPVIVVFEGWHAAGVGTAISRILRCLDPRGYTLHNFQEPDQEVKVRISTAGCYDLQDRPITVRWKLLYGNHATNCEPGEAPDTWIIRVPWDDALPEGRTAVALIANNGRHDSNPAVVNIFRKRGVP